MTHAPASLNVTSAPAPPSSDWLALTKPSLPDARGKQPTPTYFSSPAIEANNWPEFVCQTPPRLLSKPQLAQVCLSNPS
ncbi:hypothetical protein PCASD_06849 [Puccinia coronata f. sp. avenae]|uniref:Uncharacterized protein n=1 Tax=Puccinia coronata f. sp. avenae TaxID=200324 RepID=A0A2N5UQD3_9BASI|nr:hypothetical protein PCASD_06849 [Puccinia coronata f. sp. avenae]